MGRNARPGIEVLPPELWTKIFKDIPRSIDQESPHESWAQVSLTCHTFRSYMMPIMHLLFTFHPYAVNLTDLGSMPSTDRVERELERLAFYSSDPIVNYVRGVVLRPWSFNVVESSSGSHGLEYLSRKFFESLHRFRNLRSVMFVLADLNSLALQNLVHLPKLEHLGVFNCSVQTPVDVSLSLRSFAFSHEAEYEDLEELGAGTWLDLLNPDRLDYLLIDVDHPPLAILERIRTSSPFNSLSKVTITVKSDLLPHLQSLLTNVPRVRSLEVSRPPDPPQDECVLLSEGLNSLTVGPLTLLEEFIGPRELLYVILVRQSVETRPQRLQRLHITSIPGEGEHFDTIWTLLSSSKVSVQLQWLTHFHVEFGLMENEHFSKLLLLFPDLESLELESADAVSRPSLTHATFLDVVCTQSSLAQLRSLSIDWSSSEKEDLDEKHRAVKDELASKFPLLEEVWLCDWKKSGLLWHRTSDRTVMYPTTTDLELLDATLAHHKPPYSGSSFESMNDIYLRSCLEEFSLALYRVTD